MDVPLENLKRPPVWLGAVRLWIQGSPGNEYVFTQRAIHHTSDVKPEASDGLACGAVVSQQQGVSIWTTETRTIYNKDSLFRLYSECYSSDLSLQTLEKVKSYWNDVERLTHYRFVPEETKDLQRKTDPHLISDLKFTVCEVVTNEKCTSCVSKKNAFVMRISRKFCALITPECGGT